MSKAPPRRFAALPSTAPKPAPSAASRFILRAPGKEQLPWKDPAVRDDVQVQLNVKQPERLMKMVDFLAHALDQSKRQFTEEALYAACRRYLEELGLEE